MSYSDPTYTGDETYAIECTGDCVVGDEVSFERATFTGSYRNARFAGFERVKGTITADSYGSDKQQHTFTLAALDGTYALIKGRSLYANGVWRRQWADENERRSVQTEKHQRGDAARSARARRIEDREYAY